MFRIKNIRNSTVAKHNNITLAPLHPPPLHNPQPMANRKPPDIAKLPPATKPPPPQPSLPPKNSDNRVKPAEGHNKPIITTKVHPNLANKSKVALNSKLKKDTMQAVGGEHVEGKEAIEKGKKVEHLLMNCQNSSPAVAMPKQTIFQQQKQPTQHQIKNHIHINHASQKQSQILSTPPQHRNNLQNHQKEEQIKQEEKEKEQQRWKMQQQRRVKAQTERKAKAQQQRRAEEKEEQARNQARMKEMMDKVNARRKAREEEKERRIKFEKEVENQSIGGVMALSDPLAHVEMSEAVMDAQIAILLNMKFGGYPNREAIERQVEELERINRSYMLVRTDPNNPLIRGLANFRVELFNRVGELIMQAQAQLGPSASGLRVIQADSRNYPQLKGMHVTRGLQGHVNSLLKKVVLRQAEECAICLCEIEVGTSVFEVGCGHKFHDKCLEDWLNTSANCPACRYNIKYGHA